MWAAMAPDDCRLPNLRLDSPVRDRVTRWKPAFRAAATAATDRRGRSIALETGLRAPPGRAHDDDISTNCAGATSLRACFGEVDAGSPTRTCSKNESRARPDPQERDVL
jgi:hypothetical protein